MKHNIKIQLFVMFLLGLMAVGCASLPVEQQPVNEEQIFQEPEIIENEQISEQVTEKIIICEPVSEPVVEEVQVAEPEVVVEEKNQFQYDYIYEYAGYKIKAEVHNGYGYVTYPSFITDKEIATVLSAFVDVYGDFGVTYEKVGAGKLNVYFPEDLAGEDFDYVASIVNSDLTWYLNEMFAPKAEPEIIAEPVIELVVEPVIEPIAEPVYVPVSEPEPVEEQTKEEVKVSEPEVVKAQPQAVTESTVQQKPEKKVNYKIYIYIAVGLAVVIGSICFCDALTFKRKGK